MKTTQQINGNDQYPIDFTARQLHDIQEAEIIRVRKGIAVYILQFARIYYGKQEEFTMQQLVNYVQSYKQCAPDSVSRILRLLEQEGAIRYKNSSRSNSTYTIEFVEN